ncbi:MAG: hypothetical protein COX96_06680 [Candidatus Omnitrophica bacterium CG_4_10_14_0_2_um_filter_44_9]|nr:MAG: hypothetical protein COX96_06680 [Candidatus Omnitrophica bacterium CG_4_10_14_0_2_um_filter_44_9]
MKAEIAVTGVCVLSSAGETLSVLCKQSIAENEIALQIDLQTYERELSAVNTGAHELYRIQKLLLVAFLKASKMAGVSSSNVLSEKIGVFLGNSYGLEGFKSEFFRLYKKSDPDLTSPTLFPFTTANALASWLAIQIEAKGPNLTFVSGCTSSSQAILAACDALVSNECEVAFVGGVNLVNHDFHDVLSASGFRYESVGMLVLEKQYEKVSKKQPLAFMKHWQNGMLTQEEVDAIASGKSITDVNNKKFGNYKTYPSEVVCLGNNLGESVFTYDKGNFEMSSGHRKIFSLGNAVGNMFDVAGIMGVVLSIELLNMPRDADCHFFDVSGDDILLLDMDSSGSVVTIVISKNKHG